MDALISALGLLVFSWITYAITDSIIWTGVCFGIFFIGGWGEAIVEKIGCGWTVALVALTVVAILGNRICSGEKDKEQEETAKVLLATAGAPRFREKDKEQEETAKEELMNCSETDILAPVQQEETAKEELMNKKNREDKESRREALLRDFALKEAPQMWQTYQGLGSEVEALSAKLKDLKNTLLSFGMEPEKDKDFSELASMRDAMKAARQSLHTKIRDAYIQACKFAATPASAELDALRRKTIEEGVKEAESVANRFQSMIKDK